MAAMRINNKYLYQHSYPDLFVTSDKINLSVIIEENENETEAVDTEDNLITNYVLKRIRRLYSVIYECFIRSWLFPVKFLSCEPCNKRYIRKNKSTSSLSFNPHKILYRIDEGVNKSENCSGASNDVVEWLPHNTNTNRDVPPIYEEPKWKVHGNNTIIVAPVREDQRDTCTCSLCGCTRCLQHQVNAGPAVASNYSTRDASTNIDRHPNCKCEACLDVSCVPDGTVACKCVSRHGVISKPVDKNPPDIGIHTLVELDNNPLVNHRENLTNSPAIYAIPDTDCGASEFTPAPYARIIPYNTREITSTDSKVCKCSPCECYLCSSRKQATELTTETKPAKRTTSIIAYDIREITRTDSKACKCSPCECYLCSFTKQATDLTKEIKVTKRIQQSKVTPITNTLNNHCRSNPCECYYCQLMLNENLACRCDICYCNDCGDMNKQASKVLNPTDKRKYLIARLSEKPCESHTVYTKQSKTFKQDLIPLHVARNSNANEYTFEKVLVPTQMSKNDMLYRPDNEIIDYQKNDIESIEMDNLFKVGCIPTFNSFISNSQNEPRGRMCDQAKFSITRLQQPMFLNEKNIASLKYYYGQKVNITTNFIKKDKVKPTNLCVTDVAEGVNSVFGNPFQKHIIKNDCYNMLKNGNDIVIYFAKQCNFDNSSPALQDPKDFSRKLIRIIKKYLKVNAELHRVNEKLNNSHQLLLKLINKFTRRQEYMTQTSTKDNRITEITLFNSDKTMKLYKKGTITFVGKNALNRNIIYKYNKK